MIIGTTKTFKSYVFKLLCYVQPVFVWMAVPANPLVRLTLWPVAVLQVSNQIINLN